jgi:hypothetical protein
MFGHLRWLDFHEQILRVDLVPNRHVDSSNLEEETADINGRGDD